MNYNILPIFLIFSVILLPSTGTAWAQEDESRFSLRKLFGITKVAPDVYISSHIDLRNLPEWGQETENFYRNRAYRVVWFDNGKMNRSGQELINALKTSWEEGLPEPVEHLTKIKNATLNLNKRSANRNPLAEIISETDVLMTQAYFEYALNLSAGLLNPADLDIVWEIKPYEIDLVKHLEYAIEKEAITESFHQLKPKHKQYELLLDAFHQLIDDKANGGWPLPGFFPVLRENDSDENVILLKRFLLATGDLQESDSEYINSPDFDQKLSIAVKRFQERHGQEQDGIAGENTLKQMNIPLEYRLDQIRLNLDRIRWLPANFGKNHIVVNIPDYSFEYLEDGQLVQEMKVVVGKNENYTPVLEDTLHYIIFNPSWNVPNSIATDEIFPKMLEDTTYMESNNYSVLRTSYVSEDTIDVKIYDWSEVSRDSFPYFIVQHPGPFNSLGQIQFMLKNQYSIFLHDTPANHLFNVEQRDFSHGCIRLEKPEELAIILLSGQLPADTIMKYLSEEEKRAVYLDEKVPVHIVYFTSWVEENSILHFREDVYEFDKLSMSHFRNIFPEFAGLKPRNHE